MELTKNLNNVQVTNRDLLLIRLNRIRKTQSWLADQIGEPRPYISQYFNHGYYSHLEEKIEKRISKEEAKRTN
jgi:hypothetical protein